MRYIESFLGVNRMKNIVNIIKYNIRESAILYSIEVGLILLICIISMYSSVHIGNSINSGSSIHIGNVINFGSGSSEIQSASFIIGIIFIVPTVLCIMSINFVISIINFSKQLSKDRGRLLFITPVKGGEFMVAKYLEFIVTNLPFFIVAIIPIMKIATNRIDVSTSMIICFFGGILMTYMIITSLIVIARSYVNKTILVVILVITGLMVLGGLKDAIEYMLPDAYSSINEVNFGLVKPILDIIIMIILSIFASENLNSKLDIN